MERKFKETFNYKLIYIFRINQPTHEGYLKIGSATLHSEQDYNSILPNSKQLNQAAKKRINDYTSTAGIKYELLHTELAISAINGEIKAFLDKKVHEVLLCSGIKRQYFHTDRKQNEWFKTDLGTAKNAIKAVKEGRKYLGNAEISTEKSPICFRPEQEEAISKTIAQFKHNDRMLWNAKMRFGKTLSALEVVKKMKFKKTIIFTHRPVVSDGWFDDFSKIFYDTNDYLFGSKIKGKGISLTELESSGKNYVYFASIQDLRGSSLVGGKFDKNDEVFETHWDFVIIDEAHEGTNTELGKNIKLWVLDKNTKILELSGTPFNLLDSYEDNEIYTWDYVMEQRSKQEWNLNHYGDPNPYEELPEMNIYTYNLGKLYDKESYVDIEDKAFNFKEFFRTWSGDKEKDAAPIPQGVAIGDFVHESDIFNFLNLISKHDTESNYPFSTDEYRALFRHSLWMVPGVSAAKALSALMRKHAVFGSGAFEIVNVAGAGDEEQNLSDSLSAVRAAIGPDPSSNYTITISCGRLTTGVSVPEWTAVFMLSGSYSTSASNYLQTIFRVQTPANIGGKIKEKCYVFDFAPDRTLKMVAEASKISAKAGKTTSDDRKIVGEFLNFCPVISISGTLMQRYNEDHMLQQLKRFYTDKVVRNGFDDVHIYNDELLKLDDIDLNEFIKLQKIIGKSKQSQLPQDISINEHGLTDEKYKDQPNPKAKKKKGLSEEEKERLQRIKETRKKREKAISILRGISIRIPLMVYGIDIPYDEEITIDNFAEKIDTLSWNEFMPKDVTKSLFNKFTKYYDKDIFMAATRKIRAQTKTADSYSTTERIKKIAALFATFKNPDKETVLTPWRIVNMQLGDCLGGYNFFDKNYQETISKPRYISHAEITDHTLGNKDACILELNSKTGLYPLYVAYSIFRSKCDTINKADIATQNKLWAETLNNNIFVICKTPMAKAITNRTLRGYQDIRVNTHYFKDLLNTLKNESQKFIKKTTNPRYWRIEKSDKVKFNAIVGNPPYQLSTQKNSKQATPIYNLFVDCAKSLSPDYISMIMPSRWFAGGMGLNQFRQDMLNDSRIRKIVDFTDSRDCFQSVDVAGGICYLLWDKNHNGACEVTNILIKKKYTSFRNLNEFHVLVRYAPSIDILHKVNAKSQESIYDLISPMKPFGIPTKSRGRKTGELSLIHAKGEGRIDRADILTNMEMVDQFKVMTAKTSHDHAGQPDKRGQRRVLSRTEIINPNCVCTESYIILGAFDNEQEATNYYSYMRTKFARFLVSVLSFSQDITRDRFTFVPLQNFTGDSDIVWSKPIEEIDEQLYRKYELSEDEIKFIESMIKPMP